MLGVVIFVCGSAYCMVDSYMNSYVETVNFKDRDFTFAESDNSVTVIDNSNHSSKTVSYIYTITLDMGYAEIENYIASDYSSYLEKTIDKITSITYVLNIKSMKVHYLSCKTLPTDNRLDTTMSREEVIAAGYSPCGNCKP